MKHGECFFLFHKTFYGTIYVNNEINLRYGFWLLSDLFQF